MDTQRNGSEMLEQRNSSRPQGGLFSQPLVLVVSMYEILVIIFAVTGYALVTFAMVLNPRLRNICNYFILSMGLADALIVIVIVPVNLGLMLDTLKYDSVTACEFVSSINLIAIVAVSLNLCSVSLERFLVIQFPFGYEAFLTQRKAIAMIFGLWVYAILVGLLPQMGWTNGKTYISSHGSCRRPLSDDYLIFSTVAHFCIPAAIMIVSNILVYRVATTQARRIFKIKIQASKTAACVYDEQPITEVFRMNYRAAKRVSIIVGTYLICWFPQMSVLLVGLHIGYRSIPPAVFPITLALQYTSSAVNPCIFCFMNRELKATLKHVFRSRFPFCKRLLRFPSEPNVGSEFQSTPRDELSGTGYLSARSARSSQCTTV